MSFTHDDITSLGRKLDGIEFSDGERAALHGVIGAARGGAGEVSSFALPTFSIVLGGFKAAPLGGDDNGSFVRAKPLGGGDNGSFVKGKPLGGNDDGSDLG